MSATAERAAQTLERIQPALEGLEARTGRSKEGSPWVLVPAGEVRALMQKLRDEHGFEQVTFVTAVDRLPQEPRYEVSWQLISFSQNDRLRIKATANGEDPSVPSVVDLWPGAAFSERECFDMFGVRFDGNPDLRRLLMPDEYEHHPLRKDFPHQGIEPDKLYREWDKERRESWSEQ